MAYPVTVGSLITSTNFNEILDIVNQVGGVNDYGYGRRDLISIPVTTGTRITRTQWISLFNDINRLHYHQRGINLLNLAELNVTPNSCTWVMNVSTSVSTVSFTSLPGFIIDAVPTTYVSTTANALITSTYSVHISQLTPLITTYGTTVNTGTFTTYLGGSVDAIHQIVEAKWASSSTAKYFFNLGGELRWTGTATTTVAANWEEITLQRLIAAANSSSQATFTRDNYFSSISSTATVFAQAGTYSYVKLKIETLVTSTFTASVFFCVSYKDTSTTSYNLGTPWGSYWTTSTVV